MSRHRTFSQCGEKCACFGLTLSHAETAGQGPLQKMGVSSLFKHSPRPLTSNESLRRTSSTCQLARPAWLIRQCSTQSRAKLPSCSDLKERLVSPHISLSLRSPKATFMGRVCRRTTAVFKPRVCRVFFLFCFCLVFDKSCHRGYVFYVFFKNFTILQT